MSFWDVLSNIDHFLIQNEQKTAEELYSAHSDFYNNYHSSVNGVVHKFTSYLDTRIEAKWWKC